MRGFSQSVWWFALTAGCRLAGQSPYESSADFAKYAMKLREQALLQGRAAGLCSNNFAQ